MDKIRIGIVGVGSIALGHHIPGYLQSQDCVVTAICDIDNEALEKGASLCNLPPERCFRDYMELIACSEVDAIDICTPNYLHCPIGHEAIRHGKPFSVEKPVGIDYKETLALYEYAEKEKVPAVVTFSWRYRPYIRYLKHIVDSGELGKLYHIYIRWVKNTGLIPGRKLEWRFDKSLAGSGVLGDLGSHLFDFTRFIGEEFESVTADLGIEIKKRQKLGSDEIGEVTTDDWCNILAKMKSGVHATYQISRCVTTIPEWINVELYGENGMLNYSYKDGKHTLEVNFKNSITFKGGKQSLTPPPEFEASQSQAFLDYLKGRNDNLTSLLVDGLKSQSVIDAALKSYELGKWIDIAEIEKRGE